MKIRFLLLITALFPFGSLCYAGEAINNRHPKPFTQELPIGRPFLTSEIKSICHVNPSFILLGCHNRLLAFDGNSWGDFETQGVPVIIIGGSNEAIWSSGLSVFTLQKQGNRLVKKKLCDLDEPTSGATIRNMMALPNGSLFVATSNSIYRVSGPLAELIDHHESGLEMYVSNGNIYFHKFGEGGHKLNPSSGIRTLLLQENALEEVELLSLFEINSTTLAVSAQWPWIWVVKDEELSPWPQGLQIENKEAIITQVKYSGSNIFLKTDTEGILSLSLNLIPNASFPVQGMGLSDFCPIDHHRIVGTNRTSLFEIFSSEIAGRAVVKNGEPLQPNSITSFRQHVFCATDRGLYVNSRSTPHSFHPISGASGPYLCVLGGNNGIMAIGPKKTIFLSEDSPMRSVATLPVIPGGPFELFDTPQGAIGVICHENRATCVKVNDKSIEQETIDYPGRNIQPIRITHAKQGLIFLFSNKKEYLIEPFGAETLEFKPINSDTSHPTEDLWARFQSNFNLGDSSVTVYPLYVSDTAIVFKRFFEGTSQKSIWLSLRNKLEPNFQKPICLGLLMAPELANDACLANNKLWISGPEGLFYFVPSHDSGTANISNLRLSAFLKNIHGITDTLLHNVPAQLVPNTLKIRSSINRFLEITVSAFDDSATYIGARESQYHFQLEGSSGQPGTWSVNNSYPIGLVWPNEYGLKIRARNATVLEGVGIEMQLSITGLFYQQWYFILPISIALVLGVMLLLTWRRYHHAKERYMLESIINQRTEDLVREKEKTDNLLARVLPTETASELKEKGKVNTQRFQMVTVLFSDIEGFSKITEHTSPEILIDQLDKFFMYFDSVVERYRIEKIKTIGDAYMCAGGIPKKNRTNPVEVVLTALEMMQYMKHVSASSGLKNEKTWGLRIGIDTGPVIAGVVGRYKLSYDIWGSTVNTASRMESSGEAGQINISDSTHMFVREYFDCTYRGVIPVKNKGDAQMYFVKGIKASLSNNLEGLVPNHAFNVQLQLIRLGDLEEFILAKLETGLPKNLYYHNLKHTVDVYTQVELIGRSENIGIEDGLLLRTAALFHDAGHMIDYSTHEEMSAKLAREILPEYFYSQEQIDIICQLIMATQMPPKPVNLLEQIICDADLDYLGRIDFLPVSNKLYQELHEHGKIGTLREWNELQLKFIEGHQYFTHTARKLRNINKNSQLAKIRAWLEKN